MKKRIIIFTIICLAIILGVLGYVFLRNPIVSTITLDINPSIEINLDKHDKVISVNAINEDAKDIISSDMLGSSLDDTLKTITKNLLDKNYIDDNHVEIIMYTKGNVKKEDIKNTIIHELDDEHIAVEFIVIESITKEDEKLAKKYNISPAKASYIKTITNDNENINVEALADKSVSELKETKETGKHCDSGYILEGDFCLKEISREKASPADVCPRGYLEYNGVCYDDNGRILTGKFTCPSDMTLSGTDCVKAEISDATPDYTCTTGELMRKGEAYLIGDIDNREDYYCVDKSNAKEPTLRCLTNPGHIMMNGKCYNGPAPLINGGCPNGDTVVNGSCYSLDDYDQYVCPNGAIYSKSQTNITLCPDTFTYITPTITGYHCDNKDAVLSDNKCTFTRKEPAREIYECKEGYTLVDNEMCLDYSKKADKIDGYTCEGRDVRLRGSDCVTYEIIEAKN